MSQASEDRYQQLAAAAKRQIREVTVAALSAELAAGARPLLIDVREADEIARGTIPGALALSRGILEGNIEEAVPDPATPIVLYCASGNRSAFAAESLQKMGYTHVRSLAEGYKGWVAKGQPVAPPDPKGS